MHIAKYVTGLRNQVLYTQNTTIHIMLHICFCVCTIQIMYVVLNSLGLCAYVMKFMLKYYADKMSCYI